MSDYSLLPGKMSVLAYDIEKRRKYIDEIRELWKTSADAGKALEKLIPLCAITQDIDAWFLSLLMYDNLNEPEKGITMLKCYFEHTEEMGYGGVNNKMICSVLAGKEYSTSKTIDYPPVTILYILLAYLKFNYGLLENINEVINLIDPVIMNNNEFLSAVYKPYLSYYLIIREYSKTVQIPKPIGLPKIYIVGESHSLSLAWRTVEINKTTHYIYPIHINGIKIWHLYMKKRSIQKSKFDLVMNKIPDNSKIVFVIGEIDCREFLSNPEKCKKYYGGVEAAAKNLVSEYLKIVSTFQKMDHKVYVHPIPPVIDMFRHIVMNVNILLQIEANKIKIPFLNFYQDLITHESAKSIWVDGKQAPKGAPALLKEYHVDHTHLHPNYLPLFEREINKVS